MSEATQRIIIGDEDTERAAWLKDFLNDYYNATSETAENFDRVASIARKSKGSIIFLTDTLPYSYDFPDPTTNSNFVQLEGLDRLVRLVCVVTGDVVGPITGVRAPLVYIRLPSASPTREQRDRIVQALEPWADKLPPATTTVEEVARLTSWSREDRRLREQILSLSLRGDLRDAQRHLHRILRDCFDCRKVTALKISSLVQGKSGSLVLRVRVNSIDDEEQKREQTAKDYVLKISNTEEAWKLESEVKGYLTASNSKLYSKYKGHIPALIMPHTSRSSSALAPSGEEYKYIASSLPWDAIYYDFLGSDLGECMALDHALVSDPQKLQERTRNSLNPKLALKSTSVDELRAFRISFLETFLEALSHIWYTNDASRTRKKKVLWKSDNAKERKYEPLPPYKLSRRTKHWLEEFLHSSEAEIGPRLFSEFNECKQRIFMFLDYNRSDLTKVLLGQSVPVTLSPVHGDLNGSNGFLWLNQMGFPFLIDFPFYQREGHLVQDFARLEVELKFSLMDRQQESSQKHLPAFDHTCTQTPLWRDFETHLLNGGVHPAEEPEWSTGFADNVSLTYQLVSIIRGKAEIAQQKPCDNDTDGPIPFMDEYLPSLLYYTLKTITYPSLSIFKRLLAVYSSGLILKRLGVH